MFRVPPEGEYKWTIFRLLEENWLFLITRCRTRDFDREGSEFFVLADINDFATKLVISSLPN